MPRRRSSSCGAAAPVASPEALRLLAGTTVAEFYDVVALAGGAASTLLAGRSEDAQVAAAARALAAAAPGFSQPFPRVGGGISLENIVRRIKAAGLFRDRSLRSKTYKDAVPGYELLDFLVASRVVTSSGGTSARAQALGIARALVLERHLLAAGSSEGGAPAAGALQQRPLTFEESALYTARSREEDDGARGPFSAPSLDLLAGSKAAASLAAAGLAAADADGAAAPAAAVTPSLGSGSSGSSSGSLPRLRSDSSSSALPVVTPTPASPAAAAASSAGGPVIQDWDASNATAASGAGGAPQGAAAGKAAPHPPPPVPPPTTGRVTSLSRIMAAVGAAPTGAESTASGAGGAGSRGSGSTVALSTPSAAGGGPVHWASLSALLRSLASATSGARLSRDASSAAVVAARLEEVRAMQTAIQTRLAAADNARLLQGWLLKLGKRGRNWNRRWFVLQGRSLSYYKKVPQVLVGPAAAGVAATPPPLSSSSSSSSGLFSSLSSLVSGSSNIPSGVFDVCQYSLEEALGMTKSPLSMRLVSRKVAQNEVALCAESEADFEAWVKALTRIMTDHEEAGRALAELEDASLRLRGVLVGR